MPERPPNCRIAEIDTVCTISEMHALSPKLAGKRCIHARLSGSALHLRSSYTMRTKCAISDAFVRDCVFAYCASVAQYVYSLSAEHCFRLRNNAISDERVRDCALSTHSVFRPLQGVWCGLADCSAAASTEMVEMRGVFCAAVFPCGT